MEPLEPAAPRRPLPFDSLRFGGKQRLRTASVPEQSLRPTDAYVVAQRLAEGPSRPLFRRILSFPGSRPRHPALASPGMPPTLPPMRLTYRSERGQPVPQAPNEMRAEVRPRLLSVPQATVPEARFSAGKDGHRFQQLYGFEDLTLNHQLGVAEGSRGSSESSYWPQASHLLSSSRNFYGDMPDESPPTTPGYPYSVCTMSGSAELLAAEMEASLLNDEWVSLPDEEGRWAVAYELQYTRATEQRASLSQLLAARTLAETLASSALRAPASTAC